MVAPAAALTALESGTVNLFTRSTRSVVNVVDLTVLTGQAMKAGMLVPEAGWAGHDHNRRVLRCTSVQSTSRGETMRDRRQNVVVREPCGVNVP